MTLRPVSPRPLPRLLPRLLLVVLVLAALTVVGVAVARGLDRAGPAHTAAPTQAAPGPALLPADVEAVEVLRAWDRRRAAAWARGDAAALRGLYVRRSAAGRHDVAMLRAWTGRGFRVRGMQMQLLSIVVRRHAGDRLVLRVTDRLARAVAVSRGVRVPLPRDEASSRSVTLWRAGGRWQVAAVRRSSVSGPE